MPSVSLFLLVTTCVTASDALYAYYTASVAAGQSARASTASVGFHVLSYVTVFAFVQSPAYLVAACIGAVAGTYLGVWMRRK